MIKNAKFYQSTCLLEFGALFEAASLRSHRVGLQVQLQRTERRPVVNTASKCKTFRGCRLARTWCSYVGLIFCIKGITTTCPRSTVTLSLVMCVCRFAENRLGSDLTMTCIFTSYILRALAFNGEYTAE